MVVALELGHRIGVYIVGDKQHSAISTSILSLVGLLLAFSFSMAAQRFDARRRAIVAETNAIGTFWLRTSFFPEPTRSEMRVRVRRYVDLHFEHRAAGVNLARTTEIEGEA